MTSRRDLARAVSAEVDGGRAELLPDPDRADAWLLTVDGAPQSHVDLSDPTRLQFEYVRWLAHLAVVRPPPREVLHLGGGGLTLARHLCVVAPRARQRVVEVDGALVEFVRAHLPLPRSPRFGRISVRVDDARTALASARPGGTDLVVLDAFSGARVPAHLTSVEFFALARATLRPEGCLAVNIADGGPLPYARAVAATLLEVFPELAVVSLPETLRGRRFGNLVLIAEDRRPGLDLISRLSRLLAAETFPARLTAGDKAREFASGAVPLRDAGPPLPSPVPPVGWLSDRAR